MGMGEGYGPNQATPSSASQDFVSRATCTYNLTLFFHVPPLIFLVFNWTGATVCRAKGAPAFKVRFSWPRSESSPLFVSFLNFLLT